MASYNGSAGSFDVVIPAFNAESHVSCALESARVAGANEIFLVDDYSEDDTAEIGRRFGATVIRHVRNRGAAQARRSGLERVMSEFIVFLDADDELISGEHNAMMTVLMSRKGAGAIVGRYRERRVGYSETPLAPQAFTIIDLSSLLSLAHSPGPPGAILWKTQAIKSSFYASPPMLNPRYAEDFEMIVRVATHSHILTWPRAACVYQTARGKSSNIEASEEARWSLTDYYVRHTGATTTAHSQRARRGALFLRQSRAQLRAGNTVGGAIAFIRACLQHPRLAARPVARRVSLRGYRESLKRLRGRKLR